MRGRGDAVRWWLLHHLGEGVCLRVSGKLLLRLILLVGRRLLGVPIERHLRGRLLRIIELLLMWGLLIIKDLLLLKLILLLLKLSSILLCDLMGLDTPAPSSP